MKTILVAYGIDDETLKLCDHHGIDAVALPPEELARGLRIAVCRVDLPLGGTVGSTNIIGTVANDAGSTPTWMHDHDLLAFTVIKRPGGDADAGCVCHSNEALANAGGLDPEHDIIEVLPWLGKAYFRWGWVSSHVRLGELANIRAER